MRVIFAGTPEFAAKALEALIQSEHEVAERKCREGAGQAA